MLADYKKGSGTVGPRGSPNPWVAKMSKHCEKYIENAQSLAADADDFAKFHTMRGKEVQGQ